MKHSIIVASLCALITTLQAQAGFKDKLIRATTSSCVSGAISLATYTGINRYYAHYAQKNADPAATARANALFKEHGILQNKQVPIVLGRVDILR